MIVQMGLEGTTGDAFTLSQHSAAGAALEERQSWSDFVQDLPARRIGELFGSDPRTALQRYPADQGQRPNWAQQLYTNLVRNLGYHSIDELESTLRKKNARV